VQQRSFETVDVPALLARVIQIARQQSVASQLPRVDVEALFDLAKLSPQMRESAIQAIEHAGVSLTEPTGNDLITMSGEGNQAHRNHSPVRSIGANEENIRAARARLIRDRWSRHPWKQILTAQEEVGLSMLVRGPEVALTQELPAEYRRQLSDGDERAIAYDAFVLHNLGLVWSFIQKLPAGGMESDDIVQHGFFGLSRAIQKFDATLGNKFSIYATWWIRQAVQRGLANEASLIRLPAHMHERINKVTQARSHLMMLYGRCTAKDISSATNLPVSQVEECLRLNAGIVSLDMPIGEGGGPALGDFIPEDYERLTDPAVLFEQKATLSVIERCLAMLPARQADILRLRAGLVGGEPKTLDQIGQIYGLTRERIRQLERQAHESLRPLLEQQGIKRTGRPESDKKTELSRPRTQKGQRRHASSSAQASTTRAAPPAPATPSTYATAPPATRALHQTEPAGQASDSAPTKPTTCKPVKDSGH
jgi:RNA polymerase sigma factor (sigma-70 family)